MGERESEEFKSLEEEVFKALDHQRRRDILRFVGEGKKPTFTEIMNATKSPDSPTLSYHLRNLSPFLELKNGRYDLNPIGKAAYTLLLRTATYDRVALLHRKKFGAIFGHIVLWISAIAAGLVLEVDPFMTTISLPSLAAVSLMMINALFE
ncbi:MAG: helix-turn-helix domain-containing protein [Candidatus Bathyarchaeota archaeon]|nr:helix-turn-helix domain-containing protein [Candidatus Bathyarchaeota archaeon]MDH5686900.1 helix-turn-helix domain-containing protein [Candidatus Bathyarchaeota archaeon]